MAQTTLEELKKDAGWYPTTRLRFLNTPDRGRLLQQRWSRSNGDMEWRTVEVAEPDTREG